MLEHPNAMLDDEEEVDAGQRSQALPHAVEGREQIGIGAVLPVVVMAVVVVVMALRLQREDQMDYTALALFFYF